jgi:16S rRNA (uracil1498-N3)-methyltransferase
MFLEKHASEMRDHTKSEYMARRRFFVTEVRNGEAEVAGDDAQHLTRVLRVEAGQLYEISDNTHAYLAEVTEARKNRVVFRTVQPVPPHPRGVRVHLYAALIKFDHFEWIIEKATELGVERIIPIRAERSERGLEHAAPKRLERWRRIAVEASQQSRRDRLPHIDQLETFAAALHADAHVRIACDEQPGAERILEALPPERSLSDTVAAMIGPEGGWTSAERAQFSETGWIPVTLGPQILRAETAAAAAVAVLNAAWPIEPWLEAP